MADSPKRSNLLQFALIFALIYLGSQMVMRFIFPNQFGGEPQESGIRLSPPSATFTVGHHPVVTLENKTAEELVLPARCPRPPLDISFVEQSGGAEKLTPLEATENTVPCGDISPIPAGQSAVIDLAPWKYSAFERLGTYELRVPVSPGQRVSGSGSVQGSGSTALPIEHQLTARVTMVEPGAITKLFRTFITAPFLNALIFIASIVPDHNLGLAIIILTIIVKLLLFWPTQKAMEGQKKMQLLQPKLEELKRKHPNDAQKIQEETMRLWKEHKINPLSACLPTLIQFPILIGLFYVIRDGSHLALSRHLIYPLYQDLDWTFGTNFLGLNLLLPSVFLMPPLLVILQFIQMKLAFAIVKRKKQKEGGVIDLKKELNAPQSPQDIQQKMMLYGLPLMIGFFAFQFPAAVSLYWGVSTIFGIAQQIIVNKEHIRP